MDDYEQLDGERRVPVLRLNSSQAIVTPDITGHFPTLPSGYSWTKTSVNVGQVGLSYRLFHAKVATGKAQSDRAFRQGVRRVRAICSSVR